MILQHTVITSDTCNALKLLRFIMENNRWQVDYKLLHSLKQGGIQERLVQFWAA